jgi:hypothetical protein
MKKDTFETFVQGLYNELTKVLKDKNNDYTAGSRDAFANFEASRDYGVVPSHWSLCPYGRQGKESSDIL